VCRAATSPFMHFVHNVVVSYVSFVIRKNKKKIYIYIYIYNNNNNNKKGELGIGRREESSGNDVVC
jgi:hypothetical protein